MNLLPKLTQHLVDRVLLMVVVAGVTLATIGVWLYAHDRSAIDLEAQLNRERAVVLEAIAQTQARIDQLTADLAKEEDRATRSAKIVNQLEQIQSTWTWFGGNRAQAKANAERLERMKETNKAAVARVAELKQEVRRTTWERDGHEINRDRIDQQLKSEAERKSTVSYYFRRAWLRARSWLIFAAALYVLGPVLWRVRSAKRAMPSIAIS